MFSKSALRNICGIECEATPCAAQKGFVGVTTVRFYVRGKRHCLCSLDRQRLVVCPVCHTLADTVGINRPQRLMDTLDIHSERVCHRCASDLELPPGDLIKFSVTFAKHSRWAALHCRKYADEGEDKKVHQEMEKKWQNATQSLFGKRVLPFKPTPRLAWLVDARLPDIVKSK